LLTFAFLCWRVPTCAGPALERLVALKAKVAEINPKYYEAVESDRLAREKELEEERKRAEVRQQ